MRDQFRFLGPELDSKYHALLSNVAFGKDAPPPPAGPTAAQAGYGENPAVLWQASNRSEEQFIKYMLSGPQTEAMLHTTTAVTMVNGGVKENVLPPSASAVVNFWILRGETVASVIERVRAIVAADRVKVTDISASIDPSPVADPYGKECRLLERSIRQTWGETGLVVSPYLVIGGADTKCFAASPMTKNVFRLTAVRVESAADAARWHGVNERVLVKEYAGSIAFFHNLIVNAEKL